MPVKVELTEGNRASINLYLAHGGKKMDVQVDSTDNTLTIDDPYQCPHLFTLFKHFNKTVVLDPNIHLGDRIFNCEPEVLILYLYGIHDDLDIHLKPHIIVISRFNDFNKFRLRLLFALEYWEKRHGKLNLLLRFAVLDNILHAMNHPHRILFTWSEDTIQTIQYAFRYFFLPKPLLEDLYNSKLTIPGMAAFMRVPHQYANRAMCIFQNFTSCGIIKFKEPFSEKDLEDLLLYPKMFELFFTTFPEHVSKLKLSLTDLNIRKLSGFNLHHYYPSYNDDDRIAYLHSILRHPSKSHDLLTQLYEACKNEKEEKMVVHRDCPRYNTKESEVAKLKPLLTQLRTNFIETQSDDTTKEDVRIFSLRPGMQRIADRTQDMRTELIRPFWYYSYKNNRYRKVKPKNIIVIYSKALDVETEFSDLMIQEVVEFQELIIEIFLALYDTKQIIVPFIQQILENIFLTSYQYPKEAEKQCIFNLLKTIVADLTTTKAATKKRKY